MAISHIPNDDNGRFSELRKILLQEEREEIARLRNILERKEDLKEKVDPIIESHLQDLKLNFPEEYERVIDKQIEEKIHRSKNELLNLLYPVVGSMIRKYVRRQFELLRENIDLQIRETASKGPVGWIQRNLFGVSHSEWVLSKFGKAQIEGVYIIEQDSGLVLASASITDSIDMDLMAGMLTAIKSFAEDAFAKNQNIQTIQYDELTIFIHPFPKFYFAVTTEGALTASDKEKLRDDLTDFGEREIDITQVHTREFNLEIRKKLDKFFLLPHRRLQSQT